MDFGTLDQQALIEYRAAGQDSDYGTPNGAWTTLATVRANFQDVLPSKAEQSGHGIRMLTRPCRVRIRYRTDVTSAMRITWVERSRVMLIVSGPAELGRKEGLELMAEEYTTSGDAS